MRALIDHRLLIVLGKGGVGRTTLTAALGMAAARLGRRACVVELGDGTALSAKFGLPGRSFAFRPGAPGVDVWSLTVAECLDDFAGRKLKLPPFARQVVRNRFVDTFVDAVPGLHDLLLLGKIDNLLSEPLPTDPRYDLLVLDAPATGHGLTLLQAARTLTDITRAGPFHDLSKAIDGLLSDPDRTATVLATVPEELPVNETVELAQALLAEGFRPGAVIANQVEGRSLPDPPGGEAVLRALGAVPDSEGLAGLVRAEIARGHRHAGALAELRDRVGALGVSRVYEAPRADLDTVRHVSLSLAEVIG